MSTTKALTTTETRIIPAERPNIGQLLQRLSENNVTQETVGLASQLISLQERLDAKQAEREFNTAMVALKESLPPIIANKVVPNDDGTPRYSFAPIEQVDPILRPLALKHGFTYSFSQDPSDPTRVTKVCIVKHVGGHSERTPFTVRVGKGPPKSSEAQGDGAAATYAQRRALCDAFGIIVEKDTDGQDDARMEGGFIDEHTAASLRDRLENCGGDEKAFLEYAGAKTFEEIYESRLQMLLKALEKKEREAR